jgi:putative membrane protein
MSDAPRRLHPGSMVIGLVKSAPSTIVGLPALLSLGTELGLARAMGLTALAIAAIMLLTWLGWRSFTYAVAGDELVIERGLLQRSRRSIPLHRVQDVSIEQKPLQRLFGLALVRVETGGGEADEAALDSVGMAEARRLRATLRGLGGQAERVLEAEAGEPERLLFVMSLGRVLFFGLFNFSLLWIAAIWGVVQTLDQLLNIEIADVLGLAERQVRGHLNWAAALSAVLVALALGVVAGLVGTVLREFGFRLGERGGRFRRIQAALVHRAPIRGRLGWSSLEFQTLGGSDDASGRQQMAPFAREREVAAVIAASGLPGFERQALRPVAAGHVLRAVLRHGAPVLLLFGVAGIFLPMLWLGLLLLPLPVGTALLQRRYHRYALRETSLQIARGVLSQRDWIVPYDAVQSVRVRRSWLQRRLGIATISVDTAGARGIHRPDIVDVATGDAATVARALMERTGP